MIEKKSKFKNFIHNTSIFAALIIGGIAVSTLYCSKNKNGNVTTKMVPNQIGSWSLNSTAKNITMTIHSCNPTHLIYCEYEISKYNSNNVKIGSYSNMVGGMCLNNNKQIDDTNPCDTNQGDLGLQSGNVAYYKFETAKCYDSNRENKELTKNTTIPSRINCT